MPILGSHIFQIWPDPPIMGGSICDPASCLLEPSRQLPVHPLGECLHKYSERSAASWGSCMASIGLFSASFGVGKMDTPMKWWWPVRVMGPPGMTSGSHIPHPPHPSIPSHPGILGPSVVKRNQR